MYKQFENISVVTAILPVNYVAKVSHSLTDAGHDIMTWHGRGTVLDSRWYRKIFPSISPEKEFLRFLVPNNELEQVMRCIVEGAKLDRNGMGAVFSVPCLEAHAGGHFQESWGEKFSQPDDNAAIALEEQLSVIQCIVERDSSDSIARAAIDAGAHGPIVYYSEGRGLRDRLGWLRITKQAEKEVLTVVVDNADAENVFKAMGVAGKLDQPGRGFMYQTRVEKGLFNLPSHFDAHRYDANMNQVISAIDHLMGDKHWRDQSVFEVSGNGKMAGLGFTTQAMHSMAQEDKVSLSLLALREHSERMIDMMLDAGAPGLSTSYCRLHSISDNEISDGVNLVSEYCMVKCIIDESDAQEIMSAVKNNSMEAGIEDVCFYTQAVPKVLTYNHYPKPERRSGINRSMARL